MAGRSWGAEERLFWTARRPGAPPVDLERVRALRPAYDAITGGVPVAVGKAFSRMARDAARRPDDAALAYGEAEFEALGVLLEQLAAGGLLPPAGAGVFADLGSGTGKLCVAAALLHPFRRVVGVELLDELVALAQDLRAAMPDPAAVEFVAGDLVARRDVWADADVVFVNLICDRLLARVAAAAAEVLRPGALVITVTHGLPPAPCFAEVSRAYHQMSWGGAEVVVSVVVDTSGGGAGSGGAGSGGAGSGGAGSADCGSGAAQPKEAAPKDDDD